MADPAEIRKMNPQIKVYSEDDVIVPCDFCQKSTLNDVEWGALCKLGGIVGHYFCILFCSALPQKGKDNQGILGFLVQDIRAELKRGEKLKCKYCKLNKATIGCCMTRCKVQFHFTCGVQNGTLHEFAGSFSAYCPKHRTPPATRALQIIESGWTCEICFSPVLGTEEFVWPPCCKRRLFHRICIQQHAKTAGYEFACPACKDKDEFNIAMRMSGVFVPHEDASWERNNEFDDMTRGYAHCDAPVCYCPYGREHNSYCKTRYNRNWKIVRCDTCGATAVHFCCGQLKCSEWKCDECTEVMNRAPEEQSAAQQLEAEPVNLDVTQEELDEYDDIGRVIANRVKAKPKLTSKKIFCPRTKKFVIMEMNESSDSDDDDDRTVILPFVSRKSSPRKSSSLQQPPLAAPVEDSSTETENLDAESSPNSAQVSNASESAPAPSNGASENGPDQPHVASIVRVDSSDGDVIEVGSSVASNDEEIREIAVVPAQLNPSLIRKLRGHIRIFWPRPRKEDDDCQVVDEIWVKKPQVTTSEALKETMRILLKKSPVKVLDCVTLSDDDEPSSSTNQNDDSIVVVEEIIRKKRANLNLNNNSIQRKKKFTITFNR